jgi:hypothetical protein
MKVIIHPLAERFLAMRFMQLFFFIIAGLLIQSVFGESFVVAVFLGFFYLNAILVTLSATDTRRYTKYIFIGLWLLCMGSEYLPLQVIGIDYRVFSSMLVLLLLLFCVFNISHFVFFKKIVAIDSLFAVMAIYLMIAVLFARLYSVIYVLIPSAFAFPADLFGENGGLPEIAFTYFSFVTLATLGYGDIVPRHPTAQMLASIEAVIGQFYVAIVVARLMSLYAAEKRKAVE